MRSPEDYFVRILAEHDLLICIPPVVHAIQLASVIGVMEVAVINNNIFSSRALSQPDQPAHNGRMNELVDFFSKKLRNFSKESCRICHEKKEKFCTWQNILWPNVTWQDVAWQNFTMTTCYLGQILLDESEHDQMLS